MGKNSVKEIIEKNLARVYSFEELSSILPTSNSNTTLDIFIVDNSVDKKIK